MIGLKVYDLPMEEWVRAQKLAKIYLRDYPGRMGIRDCTVYAADGCSDLIVHRTENFVVVRGSRV